MLLGSIGGLLGVYQAECANHRGRFSMQWPKTTGTVGHCVRIHPSLTSERLKATYTYTVNNQWYTGHQVTLWNPTRSVPGFMGAHPIASPIDVYYNPQDPEDSVLFPGADEGTNRLRINLGITAFGMGIMMAFLLPSKFAAYKEEKKLKNIKI